MGYVGDNCDIRLLQGWDLRGAPAASRVSGARERRASLRPASARINRSCLRC